MTVRMPHPGPQWSSRPTLLGQPGDPITCRVFSEDVSVHWYASPTATHCMCGKTEQKPSDA